MDSGLYAVVSGARRLENRLDVAAENLAHVDTDGYKQSRVTFASYLTSPGPEQFPLPNDNFLGAQPDAGIPFPFSNPATNAHRTSYPMLERTYVKTAAGDLKATGNNTDIAIEGEGFLTLETPEGPLYTRESAFGVNEAGELVNPDGYRVLGDGGAPIVVGGVDFAVARDGTVSTAGGVVGRLVRVAIPEAALDKVSPTKFSAPADQVTPIENDDGGFAQGFLESSNVKPTTEMLRLIDTQRAFEVYMKMIKAFDGLDEKAVNDIGALRG